MKFAKGQPNPGKGRPKGIPNKVTQLAKDVIAQVAEGLGGAERLQKWVNEDSKNEAAFWISIYPRMLPLQVTGEGGGPVSIQITSKQSDIA